MWLFTKETRTTAEMAIIHKNQKTLYENSYYQKQENLLLKQSALDCIL